MSAMAEGEDHAPAGRASGGEKLAEWELMAAAQVVCSFERVSNRRQRCSCYSRGGAAIPSLTSIMIATALSPAPQRARPFARSPSRSEASCVSIQGRTADRLTCALLQHARANAQDHQVWSRT